jgi:hypothetical protein
MIEAEQLVKASHRSAQKATCAERRINLTGKRGRFLKLTRYAELTDSADTEVNEQVLKAKNIDIYFQIDYLLIAHDENFHLYRLQSSHLL